MTRIGETSDLLKCSFCGKTQKQVKKLIAGPGVYICDECIELCNEIIVEELSEASSLGLAELPKPLVGAVKGRAVGIGTTMLLHFDYVAANTDTKFSMPFVSLGLVAEGGSSYLFPKLVGHAKASEIFLTGRTFSAEEALQMGVINKVGSDELNLAMEFAKEVSEQPPNAVINTKALLKSSSHEALNQVMLAEGELFKMATESDEAQMAFMNFLAKKSKVN